MDQESFLGTGWSFPPEFSNTSKAVLMSVDEKDIQESIGIILSTRLGERVMEPNFGCNLEDLLFSPLDLTLKTFAGELVRTAILYFEPRVKVHEVDISQGDDLNGILLITIEYTIRSTNSRSNMVYPFYKTEGNNI